MKPRIVLDTNGYVSRLLVAESVPCKAVEFAGLRGITLMSPATLTELEQVLKRPKFAKYLNPENIEPYLAKVWELAQHADAGPPIRACRVPRDDKFLDVAVHGEAGFLVTGNADLLALHPFRSISILTPSDFLAHHN
jgi:putative PIN family toxin of toxin-antitoxin system